MFKIRLKGEGHGQMALSETNTRSPTASKTLEGFLLRLNPRPQTSATCVSPPGVSHEL